MSWFGGIVIKTENSVPGNFEELIVTDSSTWFQRGRIKPTSVVFPEPLDPTSAIVDPGSTWNETSFSTG